MKIFVLRHQVKIKEQVSSTETHLLNVCASVSHLPAQFVLLGLVAQVFDQRGHSVGLLPLPVWPRVGTQGLVSTHPGRHGRTHRQ